MSRSDAAARLLEAQFNHLVLPARVPSKQDANLTFIEAALIDRLLDAARILRDSADLNGYSDWDDIRRILLTVKILNLNGKLNRRALVLEFHRLKPEGMLILHVAEQNAGIIVRCFQSDHGQEVLFEMFEASPRSEDVLATENALQWEFPGSAVAVPYSTFADESFQTSLAGFLEQCSTESIKRFAARATKAGSSAVETRDTVEPAMITTLLMTLLEVHGRRVSTPLLRKRVRDNVCWSEGAGNPWRRLPFWLVLRVGVARHLAIKHGGEVGRLQYKFLMCVVLSSLLEDGLHDLDPQSLVTLKAKLSRRLAKLEVAKGHCSPKERSRYEAAFATLDPVFKSALSKANQHIDASWLSLRAQMKRPIRPLPRYATEADFHLILPKSGPHLTAILTNPFNIDQIQSHAATFNMSAASPNMKPLATSCFSLSQFEGDVESGLFIRQLETSNHSEACIDLCHKLDQYTDLIGSTYDGNPEQKSIMLLTVMELWMSLDQHATGMIPLLFAFAPGITPYSLNVLQLSRFSDMCRLQRIQKYLEGRQATKTKKTIFGNPSCGCFAERYFNEVEHEKLRELLERIESASERARARKREELEKLSQEYDQLEKLIAEGTCVYTQDGMETVHDSKRCPQCYRRRCARRMKIDIHEEFLPTDLVHAKAVVFELCCPPAFAAYRTATWKILATLARPKLTRNSEPHLLLEEYSQLQRFANSDFDGVCLASSTKSFLDTHYQKVRLPTDFESVCLRNGLKLGYYDSITKTWPGREQQEVSFVHHCKVAIPSQSQFAGLQSLPAFSPNSDGPTSNEVMASQTQCPPGLNTHEYMAFQSLFSGKHRRWPIILLELASSNMNFSTEATASVINQLSSQAGPSYGEDPYRMIHQAFRDRVFCDRLLDQIRIRFEVISANWRETHSMNMLITLLLRLISLAGQETSTAALRLLEQAREVTYKWIGQLREEIYKAMDLDTSRICSRYALWAALLCRRTFFPFCEDVLTESSESLPRDALQRFVESSITLQDNITSDVAALPEAIRPILVRDLKMTYRMRFLLRQSIQQNPDGLTAAINNIWPLPSGSPPRVYSDATFLDEPYHWWIQLNVKSTQHVRQQVVHYDLLEGHLLIDNKPLGRLPPEHRDSVVLSELFGQQSLLTRPSGLQGMIYALTLMPKGHEIHLGFRHGKLIVRAYSRNRVLEYIPRDIFINGDTYDLPASLVDDCTHWLDLNSCVLEIRRSSHTWIQQLSNWNIDMRTRVAQRRTSRLVDPHSPTFRHFATIFEYFEEARFLTVYQPLSKTLRVELRRLELSFNVRGPRLYCQELRAEVDPNQDAGTWYGLNSKLVLRDPMDYQSRSIIVPIGRPRYHRNAFHVAVSVQPSGNYARFSINQVLGRLDSPAEPLFVYLKAQLHAYTSAILPDPLTGRTGTEEALHILRSGVCQPWSPLNERPMQCLVSIAGLTPNREYYPKGLKVMQKVDWDPQLTTAIQCDEFLPVVRRILQSSSELHLFASTKTEQPRLPDISLHLIQRSVTQRQLYERSKEPGKICGPVDLEYDARDRPTTTKLRQNVFESVTLVSKWSSQLPVTFDLAKMMEGWPTIQGHGEKFNKFLLSEYLEVQFDLQWGSLVDFCRSSTHEQTYSLSFMFAVLASSATVNMDLIRTLVAFTISEPLKRLQPPKWPSYSHFRKNHVPTVDALMQLMKPSLICCEDGEGSRLNVPAKRKWTPGKKKWMLDAQQQAREEKNEKDCRILATFLLNQWPCAEPSLEGHPLTDSPGLDVSKILAIVNPEWLRLFQNLELSQYTVQVQQVLDHFRAPSTLTQPDNFTFEEEVFFTGYRGDEIPSLSEDLLLKAINPKHSGLAEDSSGSTMSGGNNLHSPWTLRMKENIPTKAKQQLQVKATRSRVPQEAMELGSIIQVLSGSKSTVRRLYAQNLKQSLDSLKSPDTLRKKNDSTILPIHLTVAVLEARQQVENLLNNLRRAFEHDDPRARWLIEGGLWPCTTTVSLLEQLRSTSATVFGSGMKEGLLQYAISITQLQRVLRLREADLKSNMQDFNAEQSYAGHENWDPASRPDWLLLEIDAGILIRPGQVDVALATISPASGSNSVLQMNMGQGKTSCIIPMVAACLADRKRLVRVVVPKALLLQTAQLMQLRLGGLLGREVRHVPFSRRTSTAQDTTKTFWEIHKDTMGAAGIILALPEHVMSFMLSGIQRVLDNRIAEATPMVNIQAWMRRVCRDILDESDFTLAVRTQLIYPSGQQTTVDGHPNRWETAQALLRLIETLLWPLQHDFPYSIEIARRPNGGFPLVFFLRKDAEDALISRVIAEVLRGNTTILPMHDCSLDDRKAIRRYITDATLRESTTDKIRTVFPDKPVAKQNLHLLRGLIVHRILLLTLKKRWSVQYGLHPARDPIAVPYHAKGVPSDQAEWGHPDVAILFTCLSFYYEGLTLVQLRQGLEHVVKSDDPSSEYDRWTQSGRAMPGYLKEWNVINVDDEAQLREIWLHLRLSTVVVDYYLNHFVFPRHAKQFKVKLQSSGWDIPLTSLTGAPDTKAIGYRPLTTGFSGTNDNRTLLPLTIKQQDLPSLSHTNAEVLTYLLQPRNRTYVLAADQAGRRVPERALLEELCRRQIRMLLDAGAQILEMDNISLAKAWLSVDTEAKAALYFNEDNKPFIRYRNGASVPLLASPFANDLSGCLVYLDEAHTRGTDLKMPPGATGALTLGLGQTKDHTVQAAMRLRQLATTQSVVFFATPEVHRSLLDHRSILNHRGAKRIGPLDSHDVVSWLLEQTCSGIEQLQPLYYSQGVEFCRRSQALIDNQHLLTNIDQRDACLKQLRQTEHQTLEQLYQPRTKLKSDKSPMSFSPQIAAFMKELNTRRKEFQDLGNAVHGSALQEIEQEREVAHEVESVREIQRPRGYEPHRITNLHIDIIRFAETGRRVCGSAAYVEMFACLRLTALGRKFGITDQAVSKSKLLVSTAFLKTVVLNRPDDNFVRQVSWIIWSTSTETAIILAPEEAEPLIPLVRKAAEPRAHLLTYAAPVTRKMLHFNDLSFYSIPPLAPDWKAPAWLQIELGLFAGRLYFDFDDYASMSQHLGLKEDKANDLDDDKASAHPADKNTAKGEVSSHGTDDIHTLGFTTKPLSFLQEWLAVRRKGQDFTHTPMGYVCQGWALDANHAFFSQVCEEPAEAPAGAGGLGGGEDLGANGLQQDESDDDGEGYDDGDEEELWYDATEDVAGAEGENEGVEMAE